MRYGYARLRADPAFETSAGNVVLSLVNNDTGLEVSAAEDAPMARDARLKGRVSALGDQTPTVGSGEVPRSTSDGSLLTGSDLQWQLAATPVMQQPRFSLQ